ncbi:MAG: hypothetical protein KatS3mg035_1379 [Bacteroidia bacterium]|nr:MAG: hypothetical protein KatS3mg035_1379 [Bacteroidia bacterium]
MKYLAWSCLFILSCWAILGYWIAPDNSYLAAQQIPELAQKPPFYSTFLAIAKKQKTSFLETLWKGKNSSEVWVLNPQKPCQELLQDSLLLFLKDGSTLTIAKKDLEHQKPVLFTFYLGSDPLGRDILSRLIIGTRYSLGISLLAMGITLFLGVSLGLIAGYFEGLLDQVISWLMNVLWALPSTLLALAIAFVIGKGFFTLVIAISSVLWIDIARLVRLETLRLKENDYIKAAQTLGFSQWRIIFVHLFPNLIPSIMVISFSTFTTALILEGSLSFLGLGVTPPAPSWGTLIFDGFYYIALSTGKWLLFAPATCLILTVLTLQYFAEQLKT